MIVPSIDISGGRAVKRVRGIGGTERHVVDPLHVAARLKGKYVHIVDLDGASSGMPVNLATIRKVAGQLDGQCQVGGGVRSLEHASELLRSCLRIVLGTLVFTAPDRAREIIEAVGPEKVLVSLDVLGDEVMVSGWKMAVGRIGDVTAALPRTWGIIYTDISVEGTMEGPNPRPEVTSKLRNVTSRLFYAGGVRDCRDVDRLLGMGFDGVIVGMALYEGAIAECL